LKATSPDGSYFTFDTKNPRWQIDYIFTSEDFETITVSMPDNRFSDHFPLTAELSLDKEGKE
jgi:endonuclease/exonuclease/phosphatase family metal-dependent hydrolase